MLYYLHMGWGDELMDRRYVDALFSGFPERLTVTQLSEALNQSKQTTYKWLQAGIIPAYQLDKTWLISRDEVADWVWENRNSLRAGHTPEPGGEHELTNEPD